LAGDWVSHLQKEGADRGRHFENSSKTSKTAILPASAHAWREIFCILFAATPRSTRPVKISLAANG
jgi:hypothetical protein